MNQSMLYGSTLKRVCGIAVAAVLAACGAAMPGQAQTRSKLYVGTLSCNVSGSVGLIFGSSKELGCILVRSNGTSELYMGSIKRFGIDIGFTKAAHVVWHVYSLDERAPPGTQGSAALGFGVGSNALFGGRSNSIILDSVVLQNSHSGVNFAEGIAEMSLRTEAD
jgi:hypothetical protein